MTILTMSRDSLEGNPQDEISTSDPTWPQVRSAIDSLDAKHSTLLEIEASASSQMLIGGGNGSYVISVALEEGKVFDLISPDADPDQYLLLKVGGQNGNYPRRNISDHETTLKAARWYLDHAGLEPSLAWEVCS